MSSGDGFWVGAVEVLDNLRWAGHVYSLLGREVLFVGFLPLVWGCLTTVHWLALTPEDRKGVKSLLQRTRKYCLISTKP